MEEHIIIYKNDSNGKYYKVPNALMKLNLSSGEIAVYNYLLFCEDRKTFKCHPSIKTIGKAIGMSKNTVVKYIRMLEEKCFIYTDNTLVTLASGEKRNGNLMYTIRPIEDAIKYFHDSQMSRLDSAYGRSEK